MKNLKIYLLALIISMQIPCAGQQLSTDTSNVNLPIAALRKVMIAAEEAKVLKEQKKLLEERISNLQAWIKSLEEKSAEQTVLYDSQLKNLLEQKAVYEEQLKSFEKIVRRERRKRFWTGAAGMAATATALYLATK